MSDAASEEEVGFPVVTVGKVDTGIHFIQSYKNNENWSFVLTVESKIQM